MDVIPKVKVIPTIFSNDSIAELTICSSKETVDMQPTKDSQNVSCLNFHNSNRKQMKKEILIQNSIKRLTSPDIDIKFPQFMSVIIVWRKNNKLYIKGPKKISGKFKMLHY